MARAPAFLVALVLAPALAAGSALAAQASPPAPRSPATAVALSASGLLLPFAVGAAAFSDPESADEDDAPAAYFLLLGSVFGPGLGHAYAGNSGRFWGGAALRALGWGCAIGVVAATWDNPDSRAGVGVFIAGSALYVASAVADVATAGRSARAWNSAHGLADDPCALAPAVPPDGKGVGLAWRLAW